MIQLTQKINDSGREYATLTLPWSRRIKSRQRVCLDNGEEAGLFLERGTVLRDGDLLSSGDNYVIRIIAAEESLSTVSCKDPLKLARICYHLGNRHVDIEISKALVRYQHDHVLDSMVEAFGLKVVLEKAPFEPEAGAYGSSGHGHHLG